MGTTERPARSEAAGQSIGGSIEHLIVDGDESKGEECVFVPLRVNHEALATQWITAKDDSYVSLEKMQ